MTSILIVEDVDLASWQDLIEMKKEHLKQIESEAIILIKEKMKEYLQGETLEGRLDELLEAGKTEELEKLFFSYIKKIRRIHEGEMFFKTPEFVQVFGDAEISESCRCSGMSNIDLLPANILLQDSGVSVIDYEWTFRFP